MTPNDSSGPSTPAESNNAALIAAYDRFVAGSGWVSCSPHLFYDRCHRPDPMPKLLKNDLEPHILYSAPGGHGWLYLQTRKLKLTVQVDHVTGRMMWYLKGPIDVKNREWALEPEDADLVDLVSGDFGPVFAARMKDDAQMRSFPYVRSIEGVTYRKSEKNKRMGAKGDVPEPKQRSRSPRGRTEDHSPGHAGESSSGAQKRCPAGFRRVGGACVSKQDLGKLGAVSG